MTATLIDTLTFESPINLEGSWGGRNLTPNATSTMTLTYDTDGTGNIEWECEAVDVYENIGLTFEFDAAGKRTLVDYDGVMTLPDQAMDLLKKHGVDCSEMRRTHAD